MNENDHDDNDAPDGRAEPPQDSDDQDAPAVQQLRRTPSVGARLPEGLAGGVLATGALVLRGPDEFMIDFIQAMRHPPRIVGRVVLSPRVMGQFVEALRKNLAKYEQTFGPPKPAPKIDRKQPPIEKIYEDLKLPDELLSGAYANVIMVAHSHGEFMLDFVTQFFPTSAVSGRVFFSASNLPGLLKTVSAAFHHSPTQPPQGRPGEPPNDEMYPPG